MITKTTVFRQHILSLILMLCFALYLAFEVLQFVGRNAGVEGNTSGMWNCTRMKIVSDLEVSTTIASTTENALLFDNETEESPTCELKINCDPSDAGREIEDVSRSERLFSLKLYKILMQLDNKSNIVVPTALAFVSLAKIFYAAMNETKEELAAAIELPCRYCFDHQIGYGDIVDRMEDLVTTDMQFAHNIFISPNVRPNNHYKHFIADTFHSTLLKFHNKGDIMRWFVNNANPYGMLISRFVSVDTITSQEKVILTSVSYIQGTWARDFIKCRGRISIDGGEDYGSSKTSFIQNIEEYNYGAIPEVDAKFIEIPLERGGSKHKGSIFIVRPNKKDGLKNVEAAIDENILRKLLSDGRRRKVAVRLPQIIVESHDGIEKSLRKYMDLSKTFTKDADFANLTDDTPINIDLMLHKIVITSIEEGDHALCPNITEGSVHEESMTKFFVDRPFMIVVAINDENPIIFAIARYSEMKTNF